MRELFEEERPSVVFHAAAYKHVGLMEENPVEAVRNNAVATRIVAAAAGEAGVERFVLVSTDKAVTPATVMGASKALAEWAVEAAQNRYRATRYAAVRFGNVLGSSGSVVPIFRRQIAAGGPGDGHRREDVALLHDDPGGGAADHPLGGPAAGGELGRRRGPRDARPQARTYVLEMGDPVKIVDLARNMIRLSGKEPDVDIAIEMVGRRPGEKIHEELFEPARAPAADPGREDRGRRAAATGPRMGRERVRAHRGAGVRRRRLGPGRRGGRAVGRAGAGRLGERRRLEAPAGS